MTRKIVDRLLEDYGDDDGYDDPKVFLKSPPRPEKIYVSGRRWSSPTYGTTYHTAKVYVDGQLVAELGPATGYGNGYEQTAIEWLEANMYIPKEEGYTPPRLRMEQIGIKYESSVYDVRRRREL